MKEGDDLPTQGSWSPAGDTWGRTGGRLMQTSLSLLTLEVYYRSDPAGRERDFARLDSREIDSAIEWLPQETS